MTESDKDVMQQALYALKNGKKVRNFECGSALQVILEDAAITALESAIAQPVQPKPFSAPGAWFPMGVLGHPMREYLPGKWESASWPSDHAQPEQPAEPIVNIREGKPYNNPRFEALCREHLIWGTAEAALCAVFWRSATAQPEQPKPFSAPGAWFPMGVLGHPMREYLPGKWESASWPSDHVWSEQPAQERTYTLDEISDACMSANLPDSKFESISIALTYAKPVQPAYCHICPRHDCEIVVNPVKGCPKCNSEMAQPVQPATPTLTEGSQL